MMRTYIHRRSFVGAIFTAGAFLLLTPQAATALPKFTDRDISGSMKHLLNATGSLQALSGYARKLVDSGELDPAGILEKLGQDLIEVPESNTRKVIADHVRRDFMNGNSVSVMGWRISQTEAALATLF